MTKFKGGKPIKVFRTQQELLEHQLPKKPAPLSKLEAQGKLSTKPKRFWERGPRSYG